MIGGKRSDPSLLSAVVIALSCLVCRLGANYAPYIIPVRRKLRALVKEKSNCPYSMQIDEYEALVSRLLRQRSLPSDPSTAYTLAIRYDDRVYIRAVTAKVDDKDKQCLPINTISLENAWALAQRNNAADLSEWMRRLSIEFIRQSPSHVIRYCSILAKNYRPLAEKLFNVSFISIWDELFATVSQGKPLTPAHHTSHPLSCHHLSLRFLVTTSRLISSRRVLSLTILT